MAAAVVEAAAAVVAALVATAVRERVRWFFMSKKIEEILF